MCLKKRKETFRMTTVDIVLITGRQLIRLRNYWPLEHTFPTMHTFELMGKKENDLQC
jgi:hypothetical protein